MYGLIIKDLCSLKKNIKIITLLFGVYFIIGLITKNFKLFNIVVAISSFIIPVNAISFDEKSRFEKYALTMPISRKELILSKYLLGIILGLVCVIIGLLLNIISYYLLGITITSKSIIIVFTYFFVTMIILFVTLPLFFKFGTEKARYVILAIFSLPLLIILIAKTTEFDFNIISSYLEISWLTSLEIYSILTLAIIFIIIIFIISLLISYKTYENKEF